MPDIMNWHLLIFLITTFQMSVTTHLAENTFFPCNDIIMQYILSIKLSEISGCQNACTLFNFKTMMALPWSVLYYVYMTTGFCQGMLLFTKLSVSCNIVENSSTRAFVVVGWCFFYWRDSCLIQNQTLMESLCKATVSNVGQRLA